MAKRNQEPIREISAEGASRPESMAELERPPEIEKIDSALEPLTFSLEGMTCSACVSTIERTLNSIPGVSASVNFATEQASIKAVSNVSMETLAAAVEKAGYAVGRQSVRL